MQTEKYFSLQKIDIPIEFGGMNIHVTNISLEKLTFPIPPHSHGLGGFELHYITAGEGVLIAQNNVYPISAGSLFMTGPGVVHEQQIHSNNLPTEFCVFFKVLSKNPGLKGDNSIIADLFSDTTFWFNSDNTVITDIIKKIHQELTQCRLGYISNIKLELMRLIICLVRIYSSNSLSTEKIQNIDIDENRLQLIDDMFVWHYKHLTLENMAKSLGLSVRQTEREIKKYFGTTFKQKLNQAKLNAAERLLSSENTVISDIAETVGYNSSEYFCIAFKKMYGLTPSEYRKKHRCFPATNPLQF